MECQKYYGGPVCYFVKLPEERQESAAGSGEYFDITRKTYRTSVPVLDRQPIDEPAEQQSTGNVAANATVTSTIRLPNSYSYIQRKAFGYNDDDTCSAVATGIAFNYIAKQNNMAVISKPCTAPWMTSSPSARPFCCHTSSGLCSSSVCSSTWPSLTPRAFGSTCGLLS